MRELSVVAPLVGGALVGVASLLVLRARGRVIGISGVLGGLLRPTAGDVAWRLAFVLGLVLSGGLAAWLRPQALRIEGTPGLVSIVLSGLLVGFGTRLGNGCTSGHGVCGVSRMSLRSIVATLTFMFTGALSVYVVRHVLGSAS